MRDRASVIAFRNKIVGLSLADSTERAAYIPMRHSYLGLDPAYAPGVSHHEPGGLSTRQAIDVIHALDAEIIGLDVVECNPTRDASGITAAAAMKIIKEVAGKMVRKT